MSGTAASIGDFSISDLLREAAERSISLDHLVTIPSPVDTPQMSGLFRAEEVQPGLLMSGYDLTYLTDSDLTAEMNPSVMCSLLLEGSCGEMHVGGQSRRGVGLDADVAGLAAASRSRAARRTRG